MKEEEGNIGNNLLEQFHLISPNSTRLADGKSILNECKSVLRAFMIPVTQYLF